MSGAIFGDDVNALVVDIGSYTTKAGFAGQDRPEIDIPTYLGHRNEGKFQLADVKYPTYLCGTNRINSVNEHMEIINPIKNGVVNDWNALEALLNHVFSYELHVMPNEHPVMLVELPLTQPNHREILSEIIFEKFCVTGFYPANAAVLTTFAHGKPSALVIDSGHTLTSITPVIDGFALKRNAVHIPLAGAFLANKSAQYLNKHKIDLIPRYMISHKETTQEGSSPIFTLKPKPKVTQSWHDYMVQMEIINFYTSVLQLSDVPLPENYHLTPTYYEFPNGYYGRFEDERFVIPEQLFNPYSHDDPSISSLELHKLIVKCILMCESEIRSQILSNIISVGGTTNLTGYVDRLQHCLANAIPPNFRHRLISNSYPGDRRFSAWAGGSILSSLGSFHQLWISKAEYMESGRRCIDMKCQ